MRLEPFCHAGDFDEEKLVHLDSSLNSQMATLTKSGKIPVSAIRFVAVEMMHGQDMTRFNFVRMTASLALPIRFVFHALGDFGPVFGIVIHSNFLPILMA